MIGNVSDYNEGSIYDISFRFPVINLEYILRFKVKLDFFVPDCECLTHLSSLGKLIFVYLYSS